MVGGDCVAYENVRYKTIPPDSAMVEVGRALSKNLATVLSRRFSGKAMVI